MFMMYYLRESVVMMALQDPKAPLEQRYVNLRCLLTQGKTWALMQHIKILIQF